MNAKKGLNMHLSLPQESATFSLSLTKESDNHWIAQSLECIVKYSVYIGLYFHQLSFRLTDYSII